MPAATLPAAAPRDFWALLQKMGADFAMGLNFWALLQVLCGSDFTDLGKRWRWAVSRDKFACKIAQKSRARSAEVRADCVSLCAPFARAVCELWAPCV